MTPTVAVPIAISVSIAAADLGRLGEEVARLEAAGADRIHVDIADGVLTPLFTFGPSLVSVLRAGPPIDAHILAVDPVRHVDALLAQGVSHITVQIEGCDDAMAVVSGLSRRVPILGVGIGLDTPLDALRPLLPLVRHVVVVGIRPGRSTTWETSLETRVSGVRGWLDALQHHVTLGLDGGVTMDNLPRVAAMPVDVVVSGSALFKGAGLESNLTAARRLLRR